MSDWEENYKNYEHNEHEEYATFKRFWDIINTTQKRIWFNIDPCLWISEEDESEENKDIPGSF